MTQQEQEDHWIEAAIEASQLRAAANEYRRKIRRHQQELRNTAEGKGRC